MTESEIAVKTFGAESPRDEVDQVVLHTWKDIQGFACLRVQITGTVDRVIRLGVPTARELGQELIRLADPAARPVR